MAFPSTGNGYQFTDGNVNEVASIIQPTAVAATSAATLTAAQLTSGIIVGSSTPGAQTLPTVALLEVLLVNAKVNTGFDVSFVNTAASTLTVTAGTGWTLVGVATILTLVSSTWRAVKTGDGAWSFYRIS